MEKTAEIKCPKCGENTNLEADGDRIKCGNCSHNFSAIDSK